MESVSTSDMWERQIEWSVGASPMAFFAIAYTGHRAAAAGLLAQTRRIGDRLGLEMADVRATKAESLIQDLVQAVQGQPHLLGIDTTGLAGRNPEKRRAGFREVARALNQGRDWLRCEVRTGIVVVADPGHRTEIRDIAPDLRSVVWMTMDLDRA